MDRSYQLNIFVLLITALLTDIKATDVCSYNWFDAQYHCLGQGLTIEKDKSDQPYWTGVYRRLTPWINILGCYDDSIESLQDVVIKTMTISSVGTCQEICFQESGYRFAIKMKNCLCVKSDIHIIPVHRRSPPECNVKCEDNSDDIYSWDCGGESNYNLYELQTVNFYSEERCLSLHCSKEDSNIFPQECSELLDVVCDDLRMPNNGYKSGWSLSMEQCKESLPSHYLLGNVNLTYPHLTCSFVNHQSHVVWIGVRRQIYTSINLGWEIREEEKDTFLDCQMCMENDCQFRDCADPLLCPIFCNTQTTDILTTTHKGASDELALKISLPVITIFIILLLCAIAILFYKRRNTMTKTDKKTKANVESVPKPNVDSEVDYVQNNSYFVLEQCPQYISKRSRSSNESPYSDSKEGVYDHLRDNKSRKPEVEDTYQHASASVSRDMSEYDTMANTVNQNQEEVVSYDYTHQDKNKRNGSDSRANNLIIGNPYDNAV